MEESHTFDLNSVNEERAALLNAFFEKVPFMINKWFRLDAQHISSAPPSMASF